jgi:hypothetical protein
VDPDPVTAGITLPEPDSDRHPSNDADPQHWLQVLIFQVKPKKADFIRCGAR